MRYELNDYEWRVIKPMLPKSRAACQGWMTAVFSTASFESCDQVRRGAICRSGTDGRFLS